MALPLVEPCSECHSRFCTKVCPDGYCMTYRRPRSALGVQTRALDAPPVDKMLRQAPTKK